MQVVEAVAVHTAASVPNFGYVGKIPVRSLWFLLLYASDLLQHQPRVRQSIEDSPDDVTELVAKVLTHHVERRIKQNLSLGYLSRRDDLRRVRGRIDLLQTERRHLLQRGRITCRYEEFAVDTPRNRYVVLHFTNWLDSSHPSLAVGATLWPQFLKKWGLPEKDPLGAKLWLTKSDVTISTTAKCWMPRV